MSNSGNGVGKLGVLSALGKATAASAGAIGKTVSTLCGAMKRGQNGGGR